MRERIFYVVNLDKKRISVLVMFLVGLLSSFFFLGVSVGKGNAMARLQRSQISPPENLVSDNAVSTEKTSPEENASMTSKEESQETTITESEKSTNEVTLANKAPREIELPAKLQEDTNRVETLHNQEPAPSPQKHSPKKVNGLRTGGYTIQLIAFTTKIEAEQFVKKIILDNPGLKSKPFIKESGKYWLVRLGGSNDKDSLKKLLDSLKVSANLKKNALIVKNS